MLNWLTTRLRNEPSSNRSTASSQTHQKAVARPPVELNLVYPPVDPGLPACSPKSVVQSQQDLITRLSRVVSVDAQTFEQRYLAPINNLARYVHLLPASASDEFAGPGGLFRLSLEIATYSVQASDGKIFTPTGNVEERHALEPRWKYATFLAGLCCELYRPLASAVVVDRAGNVWPKFLMSLDQWIEERRVDRYFVQWQGTTQGNVSGAESSAVIGKILPPDQLTWLDQGSPAIVREIMAIALGQAKPGDSLLCDAVARIREQVLRRDEATRRSRYGRLQLGSHIEPYFLDALRTHLESGQWVINSPQGPVFYGTDGLYIEWPTALTAVREHLVKLGLPGIPSSDQTIADMLGKSGVLVAEDSGQWQWEIVPPGEPQRHQKAPRFGLRFRDAAALLGMLPGRPVSTPVSAAMLARVEASAQAEASQTASVFAALTEAPKASVTTLATDSAEVPKTRARKTQVNGSQPGPRRLEAPEGLFEADETPAPGTLERRAQAIEAPETATDDEVNYSAFIPEAIRRTMRASDAEMVGRWVWLYRRGKHEHVADHSAKQIAISKDFIEDLDLDFSRVVATVEKLQWLGRPDNAGRGARVGDIQFADSKKFGFVITAEAAKSLGFFES